MNVANVGDTPQFKLCPYQCNLSVLQKKIISQKFIRCKVVSTGIQGDIIFGNLSIRSSKLLEKSVILI